MTRLQGRTHKLHGVTTVCSCVCDMTRSAALRLYGLLMCGMTYSAVLCGTTHSYVMGHNDCWYSVTETWHCVSSVTETWHCVCHV